ncbi:MAG TPA: helix-turn-helix domain-containing protein [Candidatus Synoicihabitans sp.]|nr:helix-turn-helix domain-containing protein [Candidatus Synoicihabitans sp.]
METFALPADLHDLATEIVGYSGHATAARWERVYPSGEMELIIHYGSGPLRCSDRARRRINQKAGQLVAGVHQEDFFIETAQLETLVSLRLRPGAAWRLFGVSAEELAEQHVELDQLGVPFQLNRLVEDLQRAKSARERAAVVAGQLRRWPRRRQPHPGVGWAVDQLCRYFAGIRIGGLADEIGLSQRRFIELFRREVGTTPKRFLRIRRFQHVLASIRGQQRISWSRLAADCGYADQAHLIRDFQAFTGTTPAAFGRAESVPGFVA